MQKERLEANIVISELDAKIIPLEDFDQSKPTIIFLKYNGGAHYTCVHPCGIYYDSTDLTICPPMLKKMYGKVQIENMTEYLRNNLQKTHNHMCGHYCVEYLKFINRKLKRNKIKSIGQKLYYTLMFNNQFLGKNIKVAEKVFG
jgi:predicted double-glycine peptidase